MGVHDGHRKRLIRRSLEQGLDGFEPHQVLELLLFYAIPRQDTNELAHRLTEVFGSLKGVFDAPYEQLLEVSGVGENTAALLKLIPQLTRLYFAAEDSDVIVQSAEAAAALLMPRFIGRRVELVSPQRGAKTDLIHLANENAKEEVVRATTREERQNKLLEVLARMLSLAEPPKRMESYDISNTGASDIVASMVVYSGTRPQKSAYRRFRIKELEGHPDDYASMQEVLRRRLQRAADGDEKFLPLPDVFLIDGGETHARAALAVAGEFGVSVPIFGMVKDDRHRTRALVTPEGREIGIVNNQTVFSLIGQIQEETHRFAITYHHESHTKSAMKSALDDIPGLGPTRREALRKHFGTIKAIREAEVDTLAAVVPRSTAEAVWKHFHKTKEDD